MAKGGAQETKGNFSQTHLKPLFASCLLTFRWLKHIDGQAQNSGVEKSLPCFEDKAAIWAKQHQWGEEDGGGGMEGVTVLWTVI